MTDDKPPESELFNVSIRAWLCAMFAVTLCVREATVVTQFLIMGVPVASVQEPFYSIVVFVVGFYFGQKQNKS